MRNSEQRLLRLPAVLVARGASRSKHYRDIDAGLWTEPVQIGRHATAWPAHEMDALLSAYIAGVEEDEIRKLVAQLHAQRRMNFEAIGAQYLSRAIAA